VDNGEEVNRFDTYVAVSLGFDWIMLEAGWLIAVKRKKNIVHLSTSIKFYTRLIPVDFRTE